MSKFIDLTGQTFGRLTVAQRVFSSNKNTRWLCMCNCGVEITVSRVHLINGHTTSCGCYQKEAAAELAKRTKTTHGLSKTNLYRVWDSMRYRCLNPNCQAYKDYGLRGITVCNEWLKFEVFYDWAINNGYKKGLSIDRIEVNGNYEPGNCKWSTMKEQGNNRRTTRMIEINGTTKSMKQWAEQYGINYCTVQGRINELGMMPIEALTMPLRRCLDG